MMTNVSKRECLERIRDLSIQCREQRIEIERLRAALRQIVELADSSEVYDGQLPDGRFLDVVIREVAAREAGGDDE